MPEASDIIAGIPELAGARVLEQLSAGPVNRSWLLAVGDARLVLRVDGPLVARLGLARRGELEIMHAVSAAGVGPEVAGVDLDAGWLLTRYVPGRHWCPDDPGKPGNLERLGRRLRQLHRLPAAGPVFDPGRIARVYAQRLGTADARRLAGEVHALARELYADAGPGVICHNDLVPANIIDAGSLTFIDWEYAALGDPYFDLAVVVREHALDTAATQCLLAAWSGRESSADEARLEAFTRLYDDLAALWHRVVDTPGRTDDAIR